MGKPTLIEGQGLMPEFSRLPEVYDRCHVSWDPITSGWAYLSLCPVHRCLLDPGHDGKHVCTCGKHRRNMIRDDAGEPGRITVSLVFALILSSLLTFGCALERHPAQISLLIQFNAMLLQTEGMEQEQRDVIQSWIADSIRVLTANPRQWEGQARLNWPRVRSVCGPYEALHAWAVEIDKLLQ